MKKYYQAILNLGKSISDLRETRKLLHDNKMLLEEVKWGLIFNNTIIDSKWLKNKSFSPGRWAAGYPMLYILYRILNDIKPARTLEFGLGESTKLTYQYFKSYLNKGLIIIEQDYQWLNFFSNEVYDVKKNTILLEIGKETIHGFSVISYKDLLVNLKDQIFDLIIVDGPWGSPHYSRYQIVALAEQDFLSEDFIILIDDYNREGEKQTIADLLAVLNRKEKKYVYGTYNGENSTIIICSIKYKFLVSL